MMKKNSNFGVKLAFIAVAVSIIGGHMQASIDKEGVPAKPDVAAKKCGDVSAAFSMSKMYVRREIKKTDIVTFPDEIGLRHTKYQGNCVYKIDSYLHLNNSEKGERRVIYHTVLRKDKDNSSWKIVTLRIYFF